MKIVLIVSIKAGEDTNAILEEVDSNGDEWRYNFKLEENFRAFRTPDGKWLLNNPKCQFISRQNDTTGAAVEIFNPIFKVKLRKGYDNIRHSLGVKELKTPSELQNIVYYKGRRLNMIIS